MRRHRVALWEFGCLAVWLAGVALACWAVRALGY